MDGSENNQVLAPPSHPTTSIFENVCRLLNHAKGRKPTGLELGLIELSFTRKDDDSDRQFGEFVSAVMNAALQWKQPKLLLTAFRRLMELGMVLSPDVVFEMLCNHDWAVVNPCVSQLMRTDTSDNTRASLSLLESLEALVAEGSKPIAAPAGVFQSWAVTQRQRLCSALPAPQDRIEEIKRHCLEHGGLPYMKQHLLPLYTKLNVETGDLLCQLATRIDSDIAFPDTALKTQVVSSLLEAGVGQLNFDVAKEDSDLEEYSEKNCALLSICLKYGCSKQIDVFFDGVAEMIRRRNADDLPSLANLLVYPLVKKLYGCLAANMLNLLEPFVDCMFEYLMELIVFHLRAEPKWPAELNSSTSWGAFCAGFAPLWSQDKALEVFLAKACSEANLELAPPDTIRTCIKIVSSCSTTGYRERIISSENFKSLVLHCAANAPSEESTPESVAEDILLLSDYTHVSSALISFGKSLVTTRALRHSGSCDTAIVQKQLDLSASAITCSCIAQLDIEDLIAQLKTQITHSFNLSDRQKKVQSIAPVLRIIVTSWFQTHLLVSPPMNRRGSLQQRMDKLLGEWNCGKPKCRRTCHLVRDFLCGSVCGSYTTMIIEDPGHRITNHLPHHMHSFLPKDLATGDVKRGSIVVSKKHPALWMPHRWARLQGVGKRILERMLDLAAGNEDLVREIIGDMYQDVRDAVDNPKLPQPDDEREGGEDGNGGGHENKDEAVAKKGEQGREGNGPGEMLQCKDESTVASTFDVVHVRDSEADERPSKKQRTT